MTIVSEAAVSTGVFISTETAGDVVSAAFRKITGIAENPDADQMAMGLEFLNDMLAMWRDSGADVGADVGLDLPLAAGDVMTVRDSFIPGIKANLTLALCDDFDREPTPTLVRRASAGLQQIKFALLPEDRTAGVYY